MQVCLIQGKAEAVSTDSGEGRGTEVLPGGLKSLFHHICPRALGPPESNTMGRTLGATANLWVDRRRPGGPTQCVRAWGGEGVRAESTALPGAPSQAGLTCAASGAAAPPWA